MTLNDLKIGQIGIITAVGGEGALRLRLLDMGLIPKTRVRVQKVAPMGDPIQIQIRGYELTIRREDAQREPAQEGHRRHETQHGDEGAAADRAVHAVGGAGALGQRH